MCKSNYDIVLAGANVGACAGAGFACIVVRWLDCELKRPTMFKKPCLKGKYVQQKTESGRKCANKPVRRHSVFCFLWTQNAHFRSACKNVRSGSKQQRKSQISVKWAKVFKLRRAKSRFQPFCVDRMRGLTKWSRRLCATNPDWACETFWRSEGKRTKPRILWRQNARFQNGSKSVLSSWKQQKGRLGKAEWRHKSVNTK